MMEPYEQSEDSSSAPDSTRAEWWVNTPPENSGLPAGSPEQRRKSSLLKEAPRIGNLNGMPIHMDGGEKHISYDQAMNWLWETGTN